MVLVRYDLGEARKSKSGKVWAKVLERVNLDGENGFAFEGRWVRREHEGCRTIIDDDLDEGALIVALKGDGSWKHKSSSVVLLRVVNKSENPEENLEELGRWSFDTLTEKKRAIREIHELFTKARSDDETLKIERARALARELVSLAGDRALELVKEVIEK